MMYLTITRPDITDAIHRLCQFSLSPKVSHLQAAQRVLHYIKDNIVSRSSAESEFEAMALASCEIDWLVKLLKELYVHQSQHVPLYCDSTAVIHIANNHVFHKRTKHIKRDCYVTWERIESSLLKTMHVRISNQLADVFTKAPYLLF